MKKIKLLALIFVGVTGLSSCGNFGDLTVDPNNPSSPDTRFLFTRVCMDTYLFALNGTYNPWTQLFPQYLSERQNIQYSNFWGQHKSDSFANLARLLWFLSEPLERMFSQTYGNQQD